MLFRRACLLTRSLAHAAALSMCRAACMLQGAATDRRKELRSRPVEDASSARAPPPFRSANMFSREKPLTAHRPCLFTHFHSPTRPLSPTRLAFAASPPGQDPRPRVSIRFGPRSSLPGRALLARLGRSTPIPTTSGGRAGMQHRWGASVGCVRGCVRVGGDRVDVRGTVVPVAVRSVSHQLSRGRFSKRRSSRVSPAAMTYVREVSKLCVTRTGM